MLCPGSSVMDAGSNVPAVIEPAGTAGTLAPAVSISAAAVAGASV
jgi:hypothetical protein